MRLARSLVGSILLASVVACSSQVLEEEESETSSHLVNDNDRTAFLFFVGKGLTKIQAAGVVGNLDQESSMNPKIKQIGGGPGRGIAQWSVNARWKTENQFASQQGGDPWSLGTQLDFVWHELTTTPAFGLATLKKATTIDAAVRAFQDKYEICGKCAVGSRVKFAENALSAFGSLSSDDGPAGDPSDPAPSADPTADNDEAPGACIVDGMAGDCITTSACDDAGGFSVPGLCPGAKNIQCCIQ